MTTEAANLEALRQARLLLDQREDEALAIYDRVIAAATGPSWSEAHVDLASHRFGLGDFTEAAGHSQAVVAAPPRLSNESTLARAGVMYCNAGNRAGEGFDESLLRSSIERCLATDQPYYAAVGLELLGVCNRRAGDNAAARSALERAVELYRELGSKTGGPSVLRRLAEHTLEDGDLVRALQYIDQGLAHLHSLDYGGTAGAHVENQLRTLRARATKS